jgi:hypothetical protein
MSDPTITPVRRAQPAGASLSDLLTAVQHVASNIANVTQTYLSVQGTLSAPALSGAPVMLRSGQGRIGMVSVTAAGSAAGHIIDANNAATTAPVIYLIPNTVGSFVVNLPYSKGLVIVPGAGQTVTVSYS